VTEAGLLVLVVVARPPVKEGETNVDPLHRAEHPCVPHIPGKLTLLPLALEPFSKPLALSILLGVVSTKSMVLFEPGLLTLPAPDEDSDPLGQVLPHVVAKMQGADKTVLQVWARESAARLGWRARRVDDSHFSLDTVRLASAPSGGCEAFDLFSSGNGATPAILAVPSVSGLHAILEETSLSAAGAIDFSWYYWLSLAVTFANATTDLVSSAQLCQSNAVPSLAGSLLPLSTTPTDPCLAEAEMLALCRTGLRALHHSRLRSIDLGAVAVNCHTGAVCTTASVGASLGVTGVVDDSSPGSVGDHCGSEYDIAGKQHLLLSHKAPTVPLRRPLLSSCPRLIEIVSRESVAHTFSSSGRRQRRSLVLREPTALLNAMVVLNDWEAAPDDEVNAALMDHAISMRLNDEHRYRATAALCVQGPRLLTAKPGPLGLPLRYVIVLMDRLSTRTRLNLARSLVSIIADLAEEEAVLCGRYRLTRRTKDGDSEAVRSPVLGIEMLPARLSLALDPTRLDWTLDAPSDVHFLGRPVIEDGSGKDRHECTEDGDCALFTSGAVHFDRLCSERTLGQACAGGPGPFPWTARGDLRQCTAVDEGTPTLRTCPLLEYAVARGAVGTDDLCGARHGRCGHLPASSAASAALFALANGKRVGRKASLLGRLLPRSDLLPSPALANDLTYWLERSSASDPLARWSITDALSYLDTLLARHTDALRGDDVADGELVAAALDEFYGVRVVSLPSSELSDSLLQQELPAFVE
jgi:hypothetical protein